jgi:competence protein ComEA
LQTPDDVAKVPDSSPQCVRIDPNTASLESILSIPGIGLTRAKAIIEYRQSHGPGAFETPEDLAKVPGIGPQTVRQIAGELSLPASDDCDFRYNTQPQPDHDVKNARKDIACLHHNAC